MQSTFQNIFCRKIALQLKCPKLKFYVGKILLFVFFTYLVNSALAQNEITFTNNGTFGFFKEGETTVSADSVSSDEAFIPTQYIAPVINSFTPASGTVGTLLTITGTNLSNPTTLTIGGVSAIPISNDGTTLVAMVMPGATSGAVNITTAGGSTSGSSNFLVTATNYPYQQQGGKLIGTGNIGASEQGSSVSISADGNTAIVGGFHDNLGQGGAWIFTRNAGIWTQQGSKLVGTGNTGVAVQGWSVSISADGNTAIVGGYTDNNYQGAAWIFTRSGTVWTQQGSKLVGTGVAGYAYQGISVSISADGNTAIVGGYMDNNTQGAAWVYTRSAGIWTQQGGKLVGTGNIGGAYQGWSVSISADGNTAIIGGEGDNSSNGAAWVFTRSGGVWTQQGSKLVGTGNIGNAQQGRSVSISADGNTVIIGGDGDNLSQGAAWVFTRSGVAWTQQGGKLVGTGSIGNANQGSSVSISADGNIVVVGGYYDNSHQGAAWVFTRNGSLWTQQGNKFVGTGVAGAYAVQGVSVAISADANTAIVGGDYDNSGVGAAWVFIPGIEVNSSLTAFSTCAGTASIYQSFTVSGSGLSANITITAPSGYEVSTTSGSGYSSSVNLTQSGGSVNSTTIYIRLSNAATGTPSGNITVSSTGLTLQNIAVTGTVNAIPATPSISAGGSTTFCAGGSVELTSSAGGGNQWYNGGVLISGQTAPTYTAATAGNYTVISTQSGCSSAASSVTTVTVNAIPATPTISTGGSTTFCAGGSVVLTSSAGGGNQWYDGGVLIAGQTTATYTVSTAGNYTVISTQSGCSSAASSATVVTVNAIPATPTISTGGSTTFCTGGSVVLTSSAGGGNQWYDGGVLIAGQTTATYTASTAGNYTVISTQSGCSSAASSVTIVTVNAIPATPTISTGGSTTFCTGGSVELTSSAGGGNQWYDGGVLIAGQTTATYTASTAGNYTVISTQSGCSSAASSVTTVTVNAIPATPTISTGGSTTFCAGGSVVLTSSAGGGNQWYDGGVLIAGQTAPTYTAATAGNYTVISTQSGCSSAASSVTTVTVNAIPATPSISAGGSSTFCAGGNVELTSSAGGGNQWYDGGVLIAGQTTATYTASTAGNYTVITTSGNCLSQESSQITVSVNPFPIQPTTFMESTTAVCQSQSNVNYSIANDPTVTYNWSYSGSGATLTASSNKLSVAFSNTATMGNISVTANNTCGTTSALTIPVMVNVLPNANFDLPVVCLPLGKAIFKNTSTISDGSQNLLSYLWNFNDPSDLTASTSINPTHYFSGIGPYDIQLTVTSINGCKQSISKYLNTISQGPVSGFSASSLKACVNDKISFTDQSTDISGTLNNWYWDFGNGNTSSLQNPNEQYVDSGSFNISLYVTDQNGCVSDTVTKQLLVYPYPKLILNSPVMVHPNSAVQLVPQYYEGSNLSFIWSPSLYLDSPQIINPVCIPLNDITYMLTITNYGTCSTSDQLSVLLLKMPVIPNAFSPNGDGINDTWVIKYLDRYPNALVSIFDRDGQKIYYSENFTSWDGKYKNQPLPIGTYYYVINLNDGSPLLNGSVTIIR